MATASRSAHREELDTRKRSSTSRYFENALRRKIVGQDEAVQALVDLYQVFSAGFGFSGPPGGKLLFLGLTGWARRALWKPRRRYCLGMRAH